ncbi:cytochrome P450 [Calocera viscosa TUFC12733]|uniref:Cytochrome P450 n=1 Tax=Calocera viscosa (strain TUFC12733) TaxID=1330018 RepID=A0A167JI70_CALVF|nr:cytochrome P450 [Calocera viscosa TUFC12733]
MLSWTLIALITISGWAISCLITYRRQLADVQYLAGPRHPFSPFTLVAALLPTTDWTAGLLMNWVGRHACKSLGLHDVIALVPFISGRSVLYTRSVEVAKQILGHKSDWDKVAEQVDALALFGENLFSSYREGWQRHRRIAGPGFKPKLYEQVWNESIRTYYEMIRTEGWLARESYLHGDVTAMTSKIALYLIASCGFGMSLSWDKAVGEQIKGMTLGECFHIVSSSIYAQIFLPKWVFRLPFKTLRKIHQANFVLESILLGIIERRKADGAANRKERAEKDVFTLLLDANEDEADRKNALTDRELLSDVFLLLVAGHETTSHALASSLGLLACNPDIQEKARKEIISVVPDGCDPTFHDSERFLYVQACFLEAIRLFPSVAGIPQRAVADTILHISADNGTTTDLVVKRDQYIVIDLFAISYNSSYYPDPDQYIPERWLDPTTEQGVNFGAGPRICIGRKFALSEATAILAMIIRDFTIEPVLREGETLVQWRLRCLDGSVANSLGFGPTAFPLRFKKRG